MFDVYEVGKHGVRPPMNHVNMFASAIRMEVREASIRARKLSWKSLNKIWDEFQEHKKKFGPQLGENLPTMM